MSKADNLKDFLVDLANAIREKKNKTGAINPQDFSAEILSIIAGDVQMPNVSGTLVITEGITEDDYEALKLVLGSNITIDAQGGIYIHFEDPEVLRVLLANGVGDGTGITTEAAEKVTDIGTWFKGNTTIETFDEFEKFSGVKEIVNGSFQNCSALESITLPEGLTKINQTSFGNNTVLKHIGLPESLTYIANSSGIDQSVMEFEDINLPNLTYLGAYAFKNTKVKKVTNLGNITEISGGAPFYNCPELEEVNLPDSVVTVRGFGNCAKLKKINLGNVTTLSELQKCPLLVDVGTINNLINLERACLRQNNSLVYDISNMNKVKTVSDLCFYQTPITGVVNWPLLTATENSWNSMLNTVFKETNITGIESLGSEIVKIGDSMCMDCKSLEYVNIPTSVKTILANAFYRCTALKEVNGLDNVASIGNCAFKDCSALTSINLSNVTSIGNDAFNGCISLVEVDLSNLETLGNSGLRNTGLINVSMPKVKSVGDSAFYTNSALKTCLMPNVETIAKYAFYSCKNLTSVGDISNVTSIGDGAFNGCSALTSINLSNVTSIGAYVFNNCSALEEVITYGEGITAIGASAFDNTTKLSREWILPNCTLLGYNAFRNSAGLTYVLPKITALEVRTFQHHTKIQELYLRDISEIKIDNFQGITTLRYFVVDNTTPPTMNGGLNNIANMVIYVPDGCEEAYKSATTWSKYSNFAPISQLATDNPTFYAKIQRFLSSN